jgi:hypothetical protein
MTDLKSTSGTAPKILVQTVAKAVLVITGLISQEGVLDGTPDITLNIIKRIDDKMVLDRVSRVLIRAVKGLMS